MSREFVCPKCAGKDMYYAKKQEITGLGGIYGQRAKQVVRPFCVNCDVEGNPVFKTQSLGKFWIVYLYVSGAVLVFLAFAYPPLAILGIALLVGAEIVRRRRKKAERDNGEEVVKSDAETLFVSCPACDASLNVGAKFCSECGVEQNTARACSQCGTERQSSGRFCSECGNPFKS